MSSGAAVATPGMEDPSESRMSARNSLKKLRERRASIADGSFVPPKPKFQRRMSSAEPLTEPVIALPPASRRATALSQQRTRRASNATDDASSLCAVPELQSPTNAASMLAEREGKRSRANSEADFDTFSESERQSSYSDDSGISTTTFLKAFIPRDKDWTPANVNRANWRSNLVRAHPELEDIRERVEPQMRAFAFGNLFGVGDSDVKDNLNREVTMQLIMQYLTAIGLKSTRIKLEEESKIRYTEKHLKDLRLRPLLLRALRESEKVYDMCVSDKDTFAADAAETETELFGQVFKMGIDDQDDQGDTGERDVNIWEEVEDSPEIIVYAQKEVKDDLAPIKAATLNKLVQRLTIHTSHDLKFMKTFMMTYQSFTTPDKLLQKLFERYHVAKPKDLPENKVEEWRRSFVLPIQLRVCNVIKYWVENYFIDFKEKTLASLHNFLDVTLVRDGHVGLQKAVHRSIAKKMSGKTVTKEAQFVEEPPLPRVPENIFKPTLTIFDVDDVELARQLTCLEFDMYSAIQPSELLNQAWSKPKLQHRAPNVRGMAKRFNQFSNWVASAIVLETKIKNRVRLAMKFVRIAQELKALNNFNSLVAICAGFNNSAIHRLKFTKEAMGKAFTELQELDATVSSNASYKVYRETLHTADPPCVPYLGVYLTDLTFVEDGNPDTVNNGLINFAKRKHVYNVILEVQQYQQQSYNLQPVFQIQNLLLNVKPLAENSLYQLSLDREPRKANRGQIQ